MCQESLVRSEKIKLPSWTPNHIREWAEQKAKERGMTLDEYINWFWQKTTPKEAERYREIVETFVKIIILQEEISELLITENAEITFEKEEKLPKIRELIDEASSLIQQAKKYREEGHDEEANELLNKAKRILEFTEYQLYAEKEGIIEIREQPDEILNELKRLTQKFLKITNDGDDEILNTAKLYVFLEMAQEVSK